MPSRLRIRQAADQQNLSRNADKLENRRELEAVLPLPAPVAGGRTSRFHARCRYTMPSTVIGFAVLRLRRSAGTMPSAAVAPTCAQTAPEQRAAAMPLVRSLVHRCGLGAAPAVLDRRMGMPLLSDRI